MGQAPASIRARQTLAVPLILAAAIALLDQATKWIVTRQLGSTAGDHRSEVAGRAFAFEYVQNSGAAFGLFRGQTFLLTLVACAVVVVLIASYQRARNPSWQLVAGLGLLLGGAIGNLIDRIRLDYVVDFVAISIWPKFNIADSAITIGVLLVVWHALFHDHLVTHASLARDVASLSPERDAPR
jgi:signal peptidase II